MISPIIAKYQQQHNNLDGPLIKRWSTETCPGGNKDVAKLKQEGFNRAEHLRNWEDYRKVMNARMISEGSKANMQEDY